MTRRAPPHQEPVPLAADLGDCPPHMLLSRSPGSGAFVHDVYDSADSESESESELVLGTLMVFSGKHLLHLGAPMGFSVTIPDENLVQAQPHAVSAGMVEERTWILPYRPVCKMNLPFGTGVVGAAGAGEIMSATETDSKSPWGLLAFISLDLARVPSKADWKALSSARRLVSDLPAAASEAMEEMAERWAPSMKPRIAEEECRARA